MPRKKPEKQPENTPEKGRADHLKEYQFQPGQSGNPGGRPKGSVGIWARIRKEMLREVHADGTTLADLIAKAVVREAARGKFQFIKELIDRDEGPIPKELHHSGVGSFSEAMLEIEEAMKAEQEGGAAGDADA